MYEHIPVPIDGSEGTMQATKHVLEPVGDESAVHMPSVVDQWVYLAAGGDQQDAVIQLFRDDAVDVVGRCAEKCEGKVSTTTAIRDGVPHRVIPDYVDEHGADMVVMGVHEWTGCDKLTSLGSVTERVIENAKCLVFIVHID